MSVRGSTSKPRTGPTAGPPSLDLPESPLLPTASSVSDVAGRSFRQPTFHRTRGPVSPKASASSPHSSTKVASAASSVLPTAEALAQIRERTKGLRESTTPSPRGSSPTHRDVLASLLPEADRDLQAKANAASLPAAPKLPSSSKDTSRDALPDLSHLNDNDGAGQKDRRPVSPASPERFQRPMSGWSRSEWQQELYVDGPNRLRLAQLPEHPTTERVSPTLDSMLSGVRKKAEAERRAIPTKPPAQTPLRDKGYHVYGDDFFVDGDNFVPSPAVRMPDGPMGDFHLNSSSSQPHDLLDEAALRRPFRTHNVEDAPAGDDFDPLMGQDQAARVFTHSEDLFGRTENIELRVTDPHHFGTASSPSIPAPDIHVRFPQALDREFDVDSTPRPSRVPFVAPSGPSVSGPTLVDIPTNPLPESTPSATGRTTARPFVAPAPTIAAASSTRRSPEPLLHPSDVEMREIPRRVSPTAARTPVRTFVEPTPTTELRSPRDAGTPPPVSSRHVHTDIEMQDMSGSPRVAAAGGSATRGPDETATDTTTPTPGARVTGATAATSTPAPLSALEFATTPSAAEHTLRHFEETIYLGMGPDGTRLEYKVVANVPASYSDAAAHKLLLTSCLKLREQDSDFQEPEFDLAFEDAGIDAIIPPLTTGSAEVRIHINNTQEISQAVLGANSDDDGSTLEALLNPYLLAHPVQSAAPTRTQPSNIAHLACEPLPLPNTGNTCPIAAATQLLLNIPSINAGLHRTTQDNDLRGIIEHYNANQRHRASHPPRRTSALIVGDLYRPVFQRHRPELIDGQPHDVAEVIHAIYSTAPDSNVVQLFQRERDPRHVSAPFIRVRMGADLQTTLNNKDNFGVFQTPPPVVFVQVERANEDGSVNMDPIACQETINLHQKYINGATAPLPHDLLGYVVYNRGHYITVVKNEDESGQVHYWACNDNSVDEINQTQFMNAASRATLFCFAPKAARAALPSRRAASPATGSSTDSPAPSGTHARHPSASAVSTTSGSSSESDTDEE